MKAITDTFYLYADGHAVQCFYKEDKDAGRIHFCHVFEKWTHASLSFTGRLIIGRYDSGVAHLIKSALAVRADVANVNRGSDGTREKGIAVGSLTIETKQGSLHWNDMPGVISSCYTYQPDCVETFDSGIAVWSRMPVAKIHRVESSAFRLSIAA